MTEQEFQSILNMLLKESAKVLNSYIDKLKQYQNGLNSKTKKLFVLYTSYPHEGGYIHGVFDSESKARKALISDSFELGFEYSIWEELTLNHFEFQKIEI